MQTNDNNLPITRKDVEDAFSSGGEMSDVDESDDCVRNNRSNRAERRDFGRKSNKDDSSSSEFESSSSGVTLSL
jgi:hypothetical protein